MLSNFIRRNGKRKVSNKAIEPRSHQKSTSTGGSSQLASSVVLDINEGSLAAQRSPVVELNFRNSNDEWFPREWLKSRSGSPEPAAHRTQKVTAQNTAPVTQNDLTQETRANSTPSPPLSLENVTSVITARKKSVPTPIVIPDPDYLMPNVQIGHSAAPGSVAPPEKPLPKANDAPVNPPSPPVSENLSSISGTTLARALMASSFVLSSTERRGSSHRSGISRQDSATLPRGSFFLSDSGRLSPVPPVPQVPATLVNTPQESKTPPESKYHATIKSGASTESEYPMSDSYITSPEMTIGAIMPRRMMTRIKEVPSPTLPTSFKAPAPAVPSAKPQRKTGHVPPRSRPPKNGVFDGPKTAVEIPLPIKPPDTSREGSVIFSSDDHSLDDFDFVPPDPMVVGSPESDSSASYIVPFAPLLKRSDTNRGQRKRRVGGGNLVREGSRENSQTDGSTALQRINGIPSAAASEHDYGELLNYDLTVSPELGTSSSTSAGYQTFPETPMVFSPIWSPGYPFLSKPDNPVIRRRLSSQKSATHRSGKLHFSLKTARRQVGNNSSIVRRSRSSLVPRQNIPSPKPAESKPKPLPSVPVDDDAGVLDETSQPSITNKTESQQPLSVPHAHPLARMSSSSSCLLEEEALQALAKCSHSSLLSIMADVLPSSNQATVPASVTNSSDNSPTSVPLPESTGTSPSDSPALTSSSSAVSSSPSPLLSSNSTTSTAITQSYASKSPLSPPPPSLGGSSFLPSPSPSTSLDEPPLRAHSVVVAVPPTDKLVSGSHSPSPSFVPPPPYHAVVSERIINTSPIRNLPLSLVPSTDLAYQPSRQASSSSLTGSVRSRARSRPPLPIGPRKPSGPGQAFGSIFSGARCNGSTSSVGSGDGSAFSWRKLHSAASQPPPKFQEPPPRWRGLTLEAAQWTFTSGQLQEIVSQAIQQSSEGSSLRYLRPDVLNGEIADEVTRLELQHLDVKAQYKALVRKKWVLMGALAGYIEGAEANDVTTAARTLEELSEVSMTLDRLADKMHDVVLQMAQLKSLRDVHNTSALAMAVRKINGLFVRQMAEKERLQHHFDTLGTERDEAWQHAEELAQDYDKLHDRVAEGVPSTCDDAKVNNLNTDASSSTGSRRSVRISAVRKSSVRRSQAGLRSRSRHQSVRPSSNLTRPTSSALEDVPPVPRLPIRPTMGPTAFPLSTGLSFGLTTAEVELAQAQREVYEMLGLSLPPSQASSRRRTMSGPNGTTLPSSPPSRPVSESLDRLRRVRSRQELGTRTTSVILDGRYSILPPAIARH